LGRKCVSSRDYGLPEELLGVVVPELLVPWLLLPELLPLLPGVSAPPVAELLPDKPKYEKMLCRQLG
jgi:hypothetical protein